MDVNQISIICAAVAVSFGAIGPALAEGRAIAAAMDAIARQPEAAGTAVAHAVRRPGHDRDHGDLLPGDRAASALRQPVRRLTMQIDWWTLGLQAVNFLVLVWLLQRFLYKPVMRLIERRRQNVEKAFAEAEDARRKAEDGRRRPTRRRSRPSPRNGWA